MISPRSLLLLALLLASCAPQSGAPTSGEADPGGAARLEEARRRWAARQPEAYVVTYTRHCFCPPQYRGPFAVTVRDGEPAEVAYEGEGEPMDEALAEAALTVDDFFDVVADAYARRAAAVHAEYDPATGQPTTLQLDYHEQVADEELGFTLEPERAPGR